MMCGSFFINVKSYLIVNYIGESFGNYFVLTSYSSDVVIIL